MSRILILGATSAVAMEIAKSYQGRSSALHLVGRNSEKLRAVAAVCTAANVSTQQADFDDLANNELVIARALEALGGIDIAVIAHGDLGDQIATEQSFAAAEKTLRTNFLSVISLLIPLSLAMERQGRGKLCVIGSVAGDRGRPRNYTYGTAKGALAIYLQGLRTRLYSAGISITTIKLGPVDSPMTASHERNMLFAKPAAVAREIVATIDRGTAEAYVPAVWSAIMPIVKGMPEALIQRLPFLFGR